MNVVSPIYRIDKAEQTQVDTDRPRAGQLPRNWARPATKIRTILFSPDVSPTASKRTTPRQVTRTNYRARDAQWPLYHASSLRQDGRLCDRIGESWFEYMKYLERRAVLPRHTFPIQ